MKKNDEYKNRLWEHCVYDGWDIMSDCGEREVKRNARERCKNGGHNLVEGTNGKATWYKDDKGAKVLRSYYTDVCKIYRGRIYKLWQGYSATTSRHIEKFMKMKTEKKMMKINIEKKDLPLV